MSSAIERSFAKISLRQIGIGMAVLVAVAGVFAYQAGAIDTWLPSNPISPSENGPAQDRQAILPVNARPVHFVDSIEQTRSYTGTVRARRRSELAFEIAGKVTNVFVDEGDRVSKGQIVAELDTGTLKAQQAAILARLAQSRSVMNELNAGPRQQTIKAAEADVTAAKSEYENATVRLKRRKSLADANAIPIEEYDQAKFDVRTTRARLQSASQRLAELNAGTREERVSAQQASVRQLEASAQEMEVAINKSKLTAPYAATVTKRYVDPGSIVQPTLPVCKLVEQEKLEAWIGLPVDVCRKIEIGNEYLIVVGQESLTVKAAAKIGELDTATRTQTVLFEFKPDSSGAVVSGQLCQIQITTEVDSSGFWIPNSALAKGIRGLSSVMILERDKTSSDLHRVRKRDIEVIKTDASRVLARGTIADGDLIIANGLHRITDGQLVSLASQPE
jgi:multidrug efflux pump subunit AcrA (membrane-fusion protein)